MYRANISHRFLYTFVSKGLLLLFSLPFTTFAKLFAHNTSFRSFSSVILCQLKYPSNVTSIIFRISWKGNVEQSIEPFVKISLGPNSLHEGHFLSRSVAKLAFDFLVAISEERCASLLRYPTIFGQWLCPFTVLCSPSLDKRQFSKLNKLLLERGRAHCVISISIADELHDDIVFRLISIHD